MVKSSTAIRVPKYWWCCTRTRSSQDGSACISLRIPILVGRPRSLWRHGSEIVDQQTIHPPTHGRRIAATRGGLTLAELSLEAHIQPYLGRHPTEA